MALLGGIGGGVTRDVLLNKVPAALTNPAYILLCLAAGIIVPDRLLRRAAVPRSVVPVHDLLLAALVRDHRGRGGRKGRPAGPGGPAAGGGGPTAGRYYIDVTSGVPPKQFVRGEWFVAIAALTGIVWVLCDWAGLTPGGPPGSPSRSASRFGSSPCTGAGRNRWPKSPPASTSTPTAAPCSDASSRASQSGKCGTWASPPKSPREAPAVAHRRAARAPGRAWLTGAHRAVTRPHATRARRSRETYWPVVLGTVIVLAIQMATGTFSPSMRIWYRDPLVRRHVKIGECHDHALVSSR